MNFIGFPDYKHVVTPRSMPVGASGLGPDRALRAPPAEPAFAGSAHTGNDPSRGD